MPTDEHKWKHVHLRLSPKNWEKLKAIIEKTRRTLNAEVTLALEKYKPKA